MEVRKIGAYTNPYSTNKTSQNKTQNPIAFGMELCVKKTDTVAKEGIKKILVEAGFTQGFNKIYKNISNIVFDWNTYKNMDARFIGIANTKKYSNFDPTKLKKYYSTKLSPSFEIEEGKLKVILMDNDRNSRSMMKYGKQEPDGIGEVQIGELLKNPVKAIANALNNALNDYADKRIFDYYREELKIG